jgi:UDP-N-acetylglucosamine 2-epimerase (non-hydrolysing)
MKTLAIVIGTRPEGIKLAPVIHLAKTAFGDQITPYVITTGQHTDILDDVISFFDITVDMALSIPRKHPSLSQLQSTILTSLESVFINQTPDIVMVQGDTMSALCGALAAFYQHIPIAYVEAGLRSGTLHEPFPEEANRRMISQLATWQFSPTPTATNALLAEGITSGVFMVGNTVVDAVQHGQGIGFSHPQAQHPYLKKTLTDKKTVLVTIHRRENWGANLDSVMAGVSGIADRFKDDLNIVWLMHANPDLVTRIESQFKTVSNVHCYPPVNHIQLLHLMSISHVVLTDSGGIQEEAPSFNVPVLVARDVTERMEGIDSGCAQLVGTDSNRIFDGIATVLTDTSVHDRMANTKNPYGDGTASHQLLTILTRS